MQIKRLSQTIVAGALGLAILVGLNVLAVKKGWRWDVTKNKRHSLAQQSVDVLKSMNGKFSALAFYKPEEGGREATEDLFRLISHVNPNFTFEFVDPDRTPVLTKEYEVTQQRTVVLLSGDKREKVAIVDEEKLVNALIRVTSARKSKIYAVAGHGELDAAAQGDKSWSMLEKSLKEQGVEVQPLTLARESVVPVDADALLILGPQKDFLEPELKLLSDYFAAGGRVFLAFDAMQRTNLDDWLKKTMPIERKQGLIIDPVSRLISGDALTPLVQDFGAHPISEDFVNQMVLFPTSSALAPTDVSPEQAAAKKNPMMGAAPASAAHYLGRTLDQAWLKTDISQLRTGGKVEFDPKTDLKGPLWIAAVYDAKAAKDNANPMAEEEKGKAKKMGRAVLVADQDFLSNKYVNVAGNLDFGRNCINWLAEREGLLTISKPKASNVFLMLQPAQRMLLTWGPLLLLPGGALVLAIGVAVKRRRSQ